MNMIVFLSLIIATIITGLVVYVKHKNKKESGAINNQSETGSVEAEPAMTGSTILTAELVYWKQYGKEDEHIYNPDDANNSQLHWWSDYAYEDNVAWPTMGNTTFNLGIRVNNLGDNNSVFGISKNSNRLWIKNESGGYMINSGYMKHINGKSVAGATIKPKENTVFYTGLIDIPTLDNRSTATYGIYAGISGTKINKIGTIVLEGAKKANYIK